MLTGTELPDFQLSVLPETAVHGASECAWDTAVEPTENGCIVTVSASGATDQKALYFDLEYDAESLHPVAAEPLDSALECEPLSVSILDDRGVVHYGMILPDPENRDGFTGDGVLAIVEFEYGAAGVSRRISAAPTHAESQTVLEDTYPATLRWEARNVGDCNQDGLVSATDLTPIGVHYDPDAWQTYGWFPETAPNSVDTDGNGMITAADITAIGRNYGRSILGGYNVYTSPDPGDYPGPAGGANGTGATLIDTVAYAETVTEDTRRFLVAFNCTLPEPDRTAFYWVRPVDTDGNEGVPSTLLTQIGLDAPRGEEYTSEAYLNSNESALELRWNYRYPGDYNFDFLIDTSDLTVIGVNQGRTAPFDEYPECLIVDGNQDGTVNMNDAWYIAELYGTFNPRYAVFASADPADYPTFNDSTPTLEPIAVVDSIDAKRNYYVSAELNYTIEDPQPDTYYWVRLIDENGYCGTPSNMVHYIMPD